MGNFTCFFHMKSSNPVMCFILTVYLNLGDHIPSAYQPHVASGTILNSQALYALNVV